jgi:3-(3-hydroxy-phenyl)propionate hydroxylase
MKSIKKNVVVVGAGPVGLLCALQLAKNGIPVTVIEAEPSLTIDLRAGTFHPPTLEMLAPLIDVNVATYWWALRKIGILDPLPGMGILAQK